MHLLNHIQLCVHKLSVRSYRTFDGKLKGYSRSPKHKCAFDFSGNNGLNFRNRIITITKKAELFLSHLNSEIRLLLDVNMCTLGRKSGKGCYVYGAKSKEKKVNSGAEDILKSFKLTAPPAV